MVTQYKIIFVINSETVIHRVDAKILHHFSVSRTVMTIFHLLLHNKQTFLNAQQLHCPPQKTSHCVYGLKNKSLDFHPT